LIHLKSFTLGNTILTNFSKKAYIFSPLRVTVKPTGIQALSLKLDTAFLANLTTGCCPDIKAKSSFKEL
jgi:hypothetical protein